MRHRRQVINLVWLHFLDNPDQVGGVGQVTIMQDKVAMFDMRILVKMIDTIRVKQRRTTLNTMDDITLLQ